MTYAVMQTALERPLPEQLKNAFRHVPGMAAMDVQTLGKDAFGMLVKGFEFDRALAMQSALAEQGVETEVVDRALMDLPPAKQLTRVEFTAEAFRIQDFLGRIFSLEWGNVLVIAAGRTRVSEFTADLVSELVSGGGEDSRSVLQTGVVRREEQREHLLLEIISRDAAYRYRAVVDRPETAVLFQSLGDRRCREPAANLCLFVQELVKFAPSAILNSGASQLCDSGDASFLYPSQTAFYREIIWLLWLVSSGRVQQ